MQKYLVERKNDNVVVAILKNKNDNTYSFVNLTKGHICPCRFESVEKALEDLDKQVEIGNVLWYEKIEYFKI